jgi:formate/nitrite transporter
MSTAHTRLKNALENKLSDTGKRSFYLGIWAGVYIAIGGVFYGLISSAPGNEVMIRLMAALSFTIGLNLVVFKKAQLFTGNNLMLVGLLNRSMGFMNLFKNWFFVYTGNLVGSLVIVLLSFFVLMNFESLAAHLESIALKKASYPVATSFIKAIYCNILVCIAIWFGVTSTTILKKVIGIIIPITMFVYLGFEHSVANMFFIPLGLSFSEIHLSQALSFFLQNIVPVTLGNIVGGLVVSLLILSTTRRASQRPSKAEGNQTE